jgi:hypothetical protein
MPMANQQIEPSYRKVALTRGINVVILQYLDGVSPSRPAMNQTTFQEALSRALEGKSQVEVARKADIAPSTISTWISGGGADPQRVFAVERALGLRPGELSEHLGYLPLDAVDKPQPPDVRYAIDRDPDLDPLDRDALLMLYNVFRKRSDLS